MLSAHIVVTVVRLVGFEVNCSQTMNTELKFNCIWPRPRSHYVGCHKVGIFFPQKLDVSSHLSVMAII